MDILRFFENASHPDNPTYSRFIQITLTNRQIAKHFGLHNLHAGICGKFDYVAEFFNKLNKT